jgi:hypothetical protein
MVTPSSRGPNWLWRPFGGDGVPGCLTTSCARCRSACEHGVFWAVAAGHRGGNRRGRMGAGPGGDSGRARARPVCGIETSRVHAHDERIVADVPLDGRRVRIVAGIRRLRCAAVDCVRQTFRGLLPGVLERHQRHTPGWPSRSAPSCAGACSAGHEVSRHIAVRVLLRLPLPALRVPRVLGSDDFAPRRRRCYAETRSSPATGPPATSTALPGPVGNGLALESDGIS